jgi:hypothetical protein
MNDKGRSAINLSLMVVVLLLAACGAPQPIPTPIPPTLTAVPPTSTPTPLPPTATPTPTSTPIPPASPSQVDREGLVAYFPFDGDADDASGNGHHGTVQGATLTTDRDGQEGRAYAFDGVDDFISVPDSPEFDIGVGDITVLLWVFREPAGGSRFQGLISHTDGAEADDGWWWTLARGTANMWVSLDDYDHIYRSGVPLDTWVHLAFVRSGSEITFYVDGTAHGDPVDHGRNISNSDGDLRVGMEGSTYGEFFFSGKIDEVRFYNRALTADEILAAMNAPEPAPAGASGPSTYLSQLEPQAAEVGWGTFSKGVYEFTSSDPSDKIREGDPIVVHEVEYPHAPYAHAPSRLV